MSPQQSRRPAGGRLTAPLAHQLERRLLAYAAAASAGLLSSALPSEAEIIYTPSNTPFAVAQVNQGPALTTLDLNNDGNPDFSFAMVSAVRYSSGTISRFKYYLKVIPVLAGNQEVRGNRPPTASAVPADATIGPQAKFGSGLFMSIKSFNGAYRKSGTWQNVEYAYVGLKFLINGQVHYGWARVKFPFAGGTKYPSIYGYAYESTPNEPIVAGDTGASPQESSNVSLPTSLGILASGAMGLNLSRSEILP